MITIVTCFMFLSLIIIATNYYFDLMILNTMLMMINERPLCSSTHPGWCNRELPQGEPHLTSTEFCVGDHMAYYTHLCKNYLGAPVMEKLPAKLG